GHLLRVSRARTQLQSLVQASHAPLERELGGILLLLEAGETEAVDEIGAEEVVLAPARQLVDAAPDGEDARLLVAHDEPGAGRRVVVVEELVVVRRKPEARVLEEWESGDVRETELAEEVVAAVEKRLEKLDRAAHVHGESIRRAVVGDLVRRTLPGAVEPVDEDPHLGAPR